MTGLLFPELLVDIHDALTEKIANASPIIELAVRNFIQQQRDTGPDDGSSATKQPTAPPGPAEPNSNQVFAEWLDSLTESGDRYQLEEIASDATTALKRLPKEEPEPA